MPTKFGKVASNPPIFFLSLRVISALVILAGLLEDGGAVTADCREGRQHSCHQSRYCNNPLQYSLPAIPSLNGVQFHKLTNNGFAILVLISVQGSANIRIGLASQDTPYNLPHCIAHYNTQQPIRNVRDQVRA